MRLSLVLFGLLYCTVALAQPAHQDARPKAPEPPPLPAAGSVPDQNLQPEITIRKKGEATIEEYRVNGRLVAVKVTPKHGVPYYLVDADGDGYLDTRRSALDPDFLIPGWVLKRW